LLTANADGIHYQQGIKGPTIENCYFEGMADDSINIYYPPNVVAEILSPTELLLAKGGIIEAGNEIEIFDTGAGRRKAQVTVVAVERARGGRKVTLSDPVEGLIAGPDSKVADTVYNLSRCGRGYEIRNNVFTNHRRHAIYAKAPDGIIEDNVLSGLAGLGIVVADCADWPEGVVPSNVIVRRNTITGVGYAKHYSQQPAGAAIQVNATARGFKLAEERTMTNIVIEDNTIIDPPSAAIFIGAASGVIVRGNRVVVTEKAQMGREAGAVIVENSEGVVIEDLTVESTRAEMTSAVEIRNSVAAGDVGVTVADVKAKLVGDAPDVDDRR
ncbi:MAG TPA: right-handed parallel beta-helix repeat-containing protein, partial [Armatimonadota bacterium]|nr:right-handed parallel beta-helix repeat-containing protein [Armatimonadota bacterium]